MNSELKKNPSFRDPVGCLNINGKSHTLYKGLNTIGRNQTATVIIRSENVSQQHAIITIVDEDKQFVSDFQSFNGTFVDKDKLYPLQLYEISDGSVIQFANITAIYKKEPIELRSTTDPCYNSNTEEVQNTQNVDDSFYAADTQAVEGAPTVLVDPSVIAVPPDCFDDDYNFSDVPSPPLYDTSVNQSTSSNLNPTIHDMPTQIFCSDVTNVVSVGESQIEFIADSEITATTSKLEGCDRNKKSHNNANNAKVNKTNPDIHDLPTQLMCSAADLNDANDSDFQNEVAGGSKEAFANKINGKSNTSNNSSVLGLLSKESEFVDQENIINAAASRNSISNLSTQPAAKSSKNKEIASDLEDSFDTTSSRKSSTNTTNDVIQETVLDDSGLDITNTSFQDQVSGKSSSSKTQDKVIFPQDSDSESQVHANQLKRRTIKPILDDSEDISTPESDTVINKSTNKNIRPLPETSPEISDIEENKQTEKCQKIPFDKETSGSETDIEDIKAERSKKELKNKHTKKNVQLKNVTSDSETEVEELEATTSKSRPMNKKLKTKKLSTNKYSESETDEELRDANNKLSKTCKINEKNITTEISLKENDADSDNDIDDADYKQNVQNSKKGEVSIVVLNKKEMETPKNFGNSNELNDSDIIPATQASDSDDDDNDFCFVPKEHSTIINKDNIEHTQESVDISQKLKDLRNKTVVPLECSEESINLRLENSEVSIKKSKDEEDDDSTPDISDIDEPLDVNTKMAKPQTSSEVDDIFALATQKIDADEADNHKGEFDMETQKLSESLVHNSSNDVFLKPATKGSNASGRKDTSTKAIEDNVDANDLFMQPTQPLTNADSPSKSVGVSNEDDIFLQPTQKMELPGQDVNPVPASGEDDIFMKPTQVITIHNKTIDAKDDETDNVFLQPTQVITAISETVTDKPLDENIFNEPTQRICIDENKIASKDQPSEDIFMQPTQVITIHNKTVDAKDGETDNVFLQPTQVITAISETVTDKPLDENIFNEPTQRICVDENKISSKDQPPEDIFMQSTQVMEINELPGNTLASTPANHKPSLSLIHKSPKTKQEHHEIESQLEVMFATQTLTLPPETSRPSNPLLNLFEGKNNADSEKFSEETHIPKSPNSENSVSIEEYSAMPTLPIDDLDDFQPVKTQHIQTNDAKTPMNKRKVKDKVQETNKSGATEEIRKSKRQQKQKISSETDNESDVAVTVRKSRRAAKNESYSMVQEPSTSADRSSNQSETKKKEDSKNESTERHDTENNQHTIRTRGKRKADQQKEISDGSVKPTKLVKSINKCSKEVDSDNNSNEQEIDSTPPRAVISKTRGRGKTPAKLESPESEKYNLKREKRSTLKTPTRPVSSKADDTKTTTLISNLKTPTTRRAKLLEKKEEVHDSATEKSTKNKNKGKKLKLEIVQVDNPEIFNNPVASSSGVSREITTRTASSRKAKKESHTDFEKEITTPTKKVKNVHDNSESKSVKAASSRRVKRQLSTDNEESTSAEPIKKRKALENSSGSEVNLSTPSRNKKVEQLNTTIGTPDRNRRKQKPKVVFTMLDSPELESLIRRLGGTVVDSVEVCTVLVTGALKRSQKLLSAVGLGKPICSTKWLNECKKVNTFLDPWDFILEDKEAENKWKFSLRESLNRSTNKKLLEDFTVQIVATNAVDVLKAAVESCGGKCLSKAPARNTETRFIVIATPENKAKYSKFLKQKPPVTVVAPEAIFDGVLRQELHLEDHLLTL